MPLWGVVPVNLVAEMEPFVGYVDPDPGSAVSLAK